MTELFGTLFPLNNILSHIKLIPPLGRDFIMQKTLIHCCWVYLARALMKSPPPPLLFLWVQQALVRQSTRDRDNKMQLEPQQKEVSSIGVERRGAVEEKMREKHQRMRGKRRQIHTEVPTLLIKKFITINTVSAFIRCRRPGPTDLLYSTLSEGHLWPPGEKPRLIWWA